MDDVTRLAHAARFGNREALDSLIDACYDEVRRLCAILVDDDSADDLAQESFVRIVRGLRRYRGESTARTWLLSIARNTCADELRSRVRQRRRHHELIARESVGVTTVADITGQVELLDLVQRLAPERREAFVLTQLLHLTYAEAATVCRCPAGTVHSRVARARDDMIAMIARATQGGLDRALPGDQVRGPEVERGSDSEAPGTGPAR